MDRVAKWFADLTLSDVADWSSLVGFVLTIWVAVSIWRIKAFYLVTARVPALAKRLKQHSTSLLTYLNDFESFSDKIREELVAAEVTAASLRRKLSGQPKRATIALVEAIQLARVADGDVKSVRGAYLQMIRVNEELKDMMSDLKWER